MSEEYTESTHQEIVHQPEEESQPVLGSEGLVLYEGAAPRFDWQASLKPSGSLKWWLVLLAIGLAWGAQRLFDSYRLEMQLDRWHLPTFIAIIGAIFFGIALKPIALERLPAPSQPMWRPKLGLMMISLMLNLASLTWFTENTVRLTGVLLWLASIALALFAISPTPFFAKLRHRLTTLRQAIYPVRWKVLLFVAIMLLAFFFRFYRLDNLPNEIALDQLSKFWDVVAMREGYNIHVFFPANQGREGGFFHLVWLVSYFVGLDFFTLKLTSALIGMLTVAVMFFMARELFNTEVAFVAMFLLSIDKWHLILSRAGYRISLLPLAVMLTIWFLARALRSGRMLDYGLTGVALGMGMYTYKSFPFAWLATGIVLLFFSWRRHNLRMIWGGILTLFCGLLVYSPMGLYAYQFWESYTYRESLQVGFMEEALQRAGLSYWEGMAINLRKSLLMFNYIGDSIDLFNISLEPHFYFSHGVLYMLALGYIFARVRHASNLILPLFIFLLTLPMMLSMFPPQEQPNIFRASGTIGPAILLAALPLVTIKHLFAQSVPERYQKLSLSLSLPSPDVSWKQTITLNFTRFSTIVMLLLLLLAARASYDSMFNRYSDFMLDKQYAFSLDMAHELRDFHGVGPSYFKFYQPGWVDVALVEMRMVGWGIDDWRSGAGSDALGGGQVHDLIFDQPPLNRMTDKGLFILHPNDQDALDTLRREFANLVLVTRYNHKDEPIFLAVYVQR